MKYLIVILFMLLCSPSNDARDFHVSVVGEERVIEFENKFPQIVKNEAVYIAYLQQYYKILRYSLRTLISIYRRNKQT